MNVYTLDHHLLKVCLEFYFLSILIDNEHRDFQRFLWYDDISELSSENLNNLKVIAYRVCRVLFGITSSPFQLSATLIEHFNKSLDRSFKEKALKSFHVDDLISGGHSVADTHKFYTQTKSHLADASFNLRKFTSNSPELDQLVNGTESDTETSKVLGLTWNRLTDKMTFSFEHLRRLAVDTPTKRQLLTYMASIYDPLGLLNPCIVKLKVLFQHCCRSDISWDCVLSDDLLLEWKSMKDDLFLSAEFVVDRWCMFDDSTESVEIHGFCDASIKAYGACVYIKVINSDGVHLSLLTSKSRIAPLKALTVPKLECAAVLCSELITNVIHELSPFVSVSSFHCWSDSTIAVHWINGDGKGITGYVSRRIQKIRSLVSSSHWLHIDTSINPSDILSRGCLLYTSPSPRDS